MTVDLATAAAQNESASTSDLVSRAAEQISTLVHDELALAKSEIVTKGKRVGVGGVLFGGAAVLALYGLGLVITLAVVALDLVWPLWLAVLAVAAVVFVIAGIAALAGRRQLAGATPPLPTEAQASVAADMEAVKNAVQEGHTS